MFDFIKLQSDVEETKSLLLSFINSQTCKIFKDDSDQVLTVEECAVFLHLSKATIYTKISKGELPVIKKAKRCYFLRSDLIEYLKKDRIQTSSEIQHEVKQALRNK
ncbi:MAG: DNA-binding protein [Bacteroidetes bacterium]|nr:MAG: DNA-binding protein [Bacteroidota bacterium]